MISTIPTLEFGRRVSAFAPATVANVGSAFDVMGFAIDQPGDTVTVSLCHDDNTPLRITKISGDGNQLPTDVTKNSASVAIQHLISHLNHRNLIQFNGTCIEIEISKGLPIGSGLGSSSASSAAAVVAVNQLLGSPLSKRELLPFAMEGERIACGSAHADNVAPALLGGCVLIRSYDPLDVIQLPTPNNVWVSVVTPQIEVKTENARKILRSNIPLASAIAQWGNVGALVAGIYRDDVALMGRALEDRIIEPERALLIPGFYEAKAAALKAGAVGCTISGSGPSIFAFCESQVVSELVVDTIVKVFESAKIVAKGYVSKINSEGARIVEVE